MKMNVKGNDNFQTQQDLYDQLNRIFNFTLDAACTTTDCKSPKGLYADQGIDALQTSWEQHRVFCNPPFSRKAAFIEKAYNEVMNGICPIVVMVLPSNCHDGKAFQKFIKHNFFYETLSGRVAFIDPATQKPMKGNNAGTTIVYFKRDIVRGGGVVMLVKDNKTARYLFLKGMKNERQI